MYLNSDQIKFVIALTSAALLGFLLWLGWASFTESYRDEGRNEVQQQWDAQKRLDLEALQLVKAKLASAEESHRTKVQELTDGLVEASKGYETSIAGIRAQYDYRLQQSERRADLYRRQAEGGPSEQSDLASHTARLDRSLTEGVLLVEELAATLGKRDAALIALGRQIKADRELLNEIPNDNRN